MSFAVFVSFFVSFFPVVLGGTRVEILSREHVRGGGRVADDRSLSCPHRSSVHKYPPQVPPRRLGLSHAS